MLVSLAALAAASTCNSQVEQGETEGAMPAYALAAPDIDLAVLGALGDTWRELPEVAERARVATHALGGAEATARAWGDPGAGCFLVVVQVPGGDASLHRALGNSLGGSEDGQLDDSQIDGGDGRVVSRFAVAAEPLRGRGRAISAAPAPGISATLAAACFYNPREPALCASMCERLLQSIDSPFVEALPGDASSVEMPP